MELVRGVDLTTWVASTGKGAEVDAMGLDETMDGEQLGLPVRYDDARLRSAFGQLSEALLCMHGSGLVHRDVKPSNVMVTGEGRVVLLDFGLITHAAADDEHKSTGNHIVGTVAYMAPEQAASGLLGPKAN